MDTHFYDITKKYWGISNLKLDHTGCEPLSNGQLGKQQVWKTGKGGAIAVVFGFVITVAKDASSVSSAYL